MLKFIRKWWCETYHVERIAKVDRSTGTCLMVCTTCRRAWLQEIPGEILDQMREQADSGVCGCPACASERRLH